MRSAAQAGDGHVGDQAGQVSVQGGFVPSGHAGGGGVQRDVELAQDWLVEQHIDHGHRADGDPAGRHGLAEPAVLPDHEKPDRQRDRQDQQRHVPGEADQVQQRDRESSARADQVELDAGRGRARQQREADKYRDLRSGDDGADQVSWYPDPWLQVVLDQDRGRWPEPWCRYRRASTPP